MPISKIRHILRRREVLAAIRSEVDSDFYFARYPDVAVSGMPAAKHYVLYGWAEGRDPAPGFSTEYYLASNPDVARAGVNPFWHFIVAGRSEGRAGSSGGHLPFDSGDILREEFNKDFYLSRYPDVEESGIDPLEHFRTIGAQEGRDPAPWFSTAYYLDANPDVLGSGLNPFVHYLMAGRAEGRAPKPDDGWKSTHLKKLQRLETTVAAWRLGVSAPELIDRDAIRRHIEKALSSTGGALAISFGHDNYLKGTGGIQLCITHEAERMKASGIAYLNVYPWQPLPTLAEAEQCHAIAVSLLLDGQEIGTASVSDLNEILSGVASGAVHAPAVIVHSLLGHAPENVEALCKAVGAPSAYFWLHDYLTICPGYTLMRNDVAYCGAPPATSAACGICRYGPARKEHVSRIASMFDTLEIDLMSPSTVALEIFEAGTELKIRSKTVAPHLLVANAAGGSAPLAVSADRPLRVAYAGTPAAHKGWHVFEDLRTVFGSGDGIEFHYFGSHKVGAHFHCTEVKVGSGNTTAMIDAMSDARIDIVIHWAEWPETYSFSTFEALAAGAFVITHRNSGNVAKAIKTHGRGRVLSEITELYALFESGEIREIAEEARRAHRMEVSLSEMTVPFLARAVSGAEGREAAQ